MPSSWVSIGRLSFTDHPILPDLPEERAGRLTFGTMNNPYKYSPEAIALWARVLRLVPGSRFLIVRPEAGVATFREGDGACLRAARDCRRPAGLRRDARPAHGAL